MIRCYSSYRKDDFFFIVMEFGGDRCLDDLELPLTNSEQITNVVIQLGMGLKHFKNNGVVHRDIKPSNIVISEKGLLKITDFGISKYLGS